MLSEVLHRVIFLLAAKVLNRFVFREAEEQLISAQISSTKQRQAQHTSSEYIIFTKYKFRPGIFN